MSKIRLMIVDDHTIVRKGIRSLLENNEKIEIVGEAKNGNEAIDKFRQVIPDIVLMDIAMPILNGMEATRQIKKQFPEVKVLILSMYNNEEYIMNCLEFGASGYMNKQTSPEDLILAINTVYKGEYFVSPSFSKEVIKKYIEIIKDIDKKANYKELTNREREILQLIAESYSNKEIAKLLYISVKTVETHRTHLMDKLDIHNSVELTKYAIRKGIISIDN
ncbi:MAG: response regulator transcription factor [Actinobacteria bacterium]|nr:response regulator transcription factor [bacterium]MBU4241729.1 response regulator transcription factor [Nanoarchaeota archaeon]MBU4314742.1 response regulator transcription factor [Actinomycetota bacterium]MBU1291736.1 response regulator transcription factor [bacterium]MBU1427461.1 response regulator transcription factor [bacterium]